MNEAEIAAVIVGITELLKSFGLPSRLAPGTAVVIGAVLGFAESYRAGAGDIYAGIMRGIVIGATATGLYAATANISKKSKPDPLQNANSWQETH